jgi:hypothetical protein
MRGDAQTVATVGNVLQYLDKMRRMIGRMVIVQFATSTPHLTLKNGLRRLIVLRLGFARP